MQQAMNVASQPGRGDDNAELTQAAELFSVLGNIVRLAVLKRLLEREWSVNELAEDLMMNQSALSQHLARLRNTGMVKVRRYRQIKFYRCEDHTVDKLLSELKVIC